MDCALVRDHLDAYVDGELEPTPVIELEGHLRACAPCRDEVELARLMKRGVQSIPRPVMAVESRARVLSALDESYGAKRGRGATYAFVAAAAVLLVVATQKPPPPPVGDPMASGPSELPHRVVERYNGELPVDVAARPEEAGPILSSKVGFRVRPVQFAAPDVRLLGARVVHNLIEGRPAAQLDYSVGKRRLTVFVFQPDDAARELLHEDSALERSGGRRQRVGSRVVTYHNVRGYPVPMLEQGGLAYAFTGDLDEQTLLRLLGSAQL